MQSHRRFVGLDVHARSIVACALDGATGELVRARFGYDLPALLAWLSGMPGPLLVVYEAGPTGFHLARELTGAGIECLVAAPSKLQRPAGERVKTDERDALHLARLAQLGQVVACRVPTLEEEATRDLVRARTDARQELTSAKLRLLDLPLRYGHRYPHGHRNWTERHLAWLRGLRDGAPAGFVAALDAGLEAVAQATARRDRLNEEILTAARTSPFAPVVTRLGCLRGIGPLTGLALAVEIGDWDRFTGRSIGSFLGLTPSEYSTGQSRRLGGITKTGNAHARTLLVEAAWHHAKPLSTSPTSAVFVRQQTAPTDARLRGHHGNQRLHQRWRQFRARKKQPTIANTAIARELAGWCWSLATMPD